MKSILIALLSAVVAGCSSSALTDKQAAALIEEVSFRDIRAPLQLVQIPKSRSECELRAEDNKPDTERFVRSLIEPSDAASEQILGNEQVLRLSQEVVDAAQSPVPSPCTNMWNEYVAYERSLGLQPTRHFVYFWSVERAPKVEQDLKGSEYDLLRLYRRSVEIKGISETNATEAVVLFDNAYSPTEIGKDIGLSIERTAGHRVHFRRYDTGWQIENVVE